MKSKLRFVELNNVLSEFSFFKQLRYRLQQKSGKNASDETTLIKTFKYFDIQNRGEIDFEQFSRALDKLGLQSLSKRVTMLI